MEHLRLKRVILHSEDVTESKGPAQRLKRFFDESGLVRGGTRLEQIGDSDFEGIERHLDGATEPQVRLDECVINFTGGSKLMAAAAFRNGPCVTPGPSIWNDATN